jgi:hypothetical protein
MSTKELQQTMVSMAETIVQAHRYLYFVLHRPVLDNVKYDMILDNTRDSFQRLNLTQSPIFSHGSLAAASYTDKQKDLALRFAHVGRDIPRSNCCQAVAVERVIGSFNCSECGEPCEKVCA